MAKKFKDLSEAERKKLAGDYARKIIKATEGEGALGFMGIGTNEGVIKNISKDLQRMGSSDMVDLVSNQIDKLSSEHSGLRDLLLSEYSGDDEDALMNAFGYPTDDFIGSSAQEYETSDPNKSNYAKFGFDGSVQTDEHGSGEKAEYSVSDPGTGLEPMSENTDYKPKAEQTPTTQSSTPSLDNPEIKSMSGDVEIKRRAPMEGAQYNPDNPAASLNLARTLGQIDPKDKSGMASRTRTMQNRAMDESNRIMKRDYDRAARARAAQDLFDQREDNIRSKWNNSRTGRESGLSWDELDESTKQGMRKRMYNFYSNQNQSSGQPSMQAPTPSAQPRAVRPDGSPVSKEYFDKFFNNPSVPGTTPGRSQRRYSPVYGEKGFTGFKDLSDGRFIQSGGVGREDMLASLVKQDSADAVNKSMFQDNNPFGSEYRPMAKKPIGTGPTPRTDSMMKELDMMPKDEQLDVINSFRKKRDEDEIYNPFV